MILNMKRYWQKNSTELLMCCEIKKKLKIKEKLYNDKIMVIYHSSNASRSDFVKFLEGIVEELIIKGDYMVIEDFNMDFMVDLFYIKKL